MAGARRAFLFVAVRTTTARAPGPPDDDGRRRLYVGTFTEGSPSEGIYRLSMDPASGALGEPELAARTVNPSFLAVAPDGGALYAVNEVAELDGEPTGAVSAFARDPATGALAPLGRVRSGGASPCHVTLDRAGRFLLVANYAGGSVAVLPVGTHGDVGEAVAVARHEGRGVDPARQSAPHAHCAIPDPANHFVLVADLGLDRVIVYRFDASRGALSPRPAAAADLADGAGPRHLAFHPVGQVVYVANEVDSTVTALRYDPASGALAELQTIAAVSETAATRNFPADLHVHPTGRFLYVSNRGHDSIAVFAIDRTTRRLRPLQLVPTGGAWPRAFALDPSGRFLLVANQRSDSVVVFRVDEASGRIAATGARVEVPVPTCVRFGA